MPPSIIITRSPEVEHTEHRGDRSRVALIDTIGHAEIVFSSVILHVAFAVASGPRSVGVRHKESRHIAAPPKAYKRLPAESRELNTF